MKTFLRVVMWIGIIGLSGRSGLIGAEEMAAPTMPSEVTLTSGRVLRGVQVIRWEAQRVVLRHAGGADPIAFFLIKSIAPESLAVMRDAALKKKSVDDKLARSIQRAKAEMNFEELQRQERFKRLIGENKIALGMSKEQVLTAWGAPRRKNEGLHGLHQWVYARNYVYFNAGKVVSWSGSEG